MGLDVVLADAHKEFERLFGFRAGGSLLSVVDDETYVRWSRASGFREDAYGAYVPDDLRAIVRDSSPIGTYVHEWLGHGSFFEQSAIGKAFLAQSDRTSFLAYIPDIEKEYGLPCAHSITIEAWASFVERKISDARGLVSTPPRQDADFAERLIGIEDRATTLGLIGQLGFPKRYDGAQVYSALCALYPSVSDAELVMLYGSRKPESDIDVFVEHGEGWETITNAWLDIYRVGPDLLEGYVARNDISVLEPLFSGVLIGGDYDRLEELKALADQPLTQEMIVHNRARSEEQSRIREGNAESYARSFAAMADALEQGLRPRTLSALRVP